MGSAIVGTGVMGSSESGYGVKGTNRSVNNAAGYFSNDYVNGVDLGTALETAKGDVFLATASGKVGIGTNTPNYKLQVMGNEANKSIIYAENNNDTGDVILGLTYGSGTAVFGCSDRGCGVRGESNIGGGIEGYFNNYEDQGIALKTNAGDVLLATDRGDVGIGTVSPQHKLDVVGKIRSSTGGFVFPDNTVQTIAAVPSPSHWTANGDNIYNNNSGKVGIRTNTPNSKLQVVDLINFFNAGDPSTKYSTAIGYQALNSNASNYNTATGSNALYTNNTGTNNTAAGYQALYSNNGASNTAVGSNALFANYSGNNNTAIGTGAGDTNGAGNKNTLIGYNADVSSNSLTNARHRR